MLLKDNSYCLVSARSILLVCLVTLNTMLSMGQGLNFRHIGIGEGLSQNAVLSMEKDYRGFMWFGTRDGLNRYDGYNFHIYKHDPVDSMSLNSSQVTAIYEDKAHNLWIGAGGIHRYDRLLDRIERVVTVEDIESDLLRIHIDDIEADHRGNIWFSVADKGVYCLRQHAGEGKEARFDLKGPYTLPTYETRQSFESYDLQRQGHELWMSYSGGLCRLQAKEDGSFPWPEEASFEKVVFPKLDHDFQFRALFLDQQDKLWVSTDEGLLYVKDADEIPHAQLYNYPESYRRVDCLSCGKSIAADTRGQLWMTSFEGLIKFNPSDHAYQMFTKSE